MHKRLPSGSLFIMKSPFKLSSEKFYELMKIIGDALVNMSEEFIKQWLGTQVGGRFMKWLTDILVTRFYDQTIKVFTRVGVIRLGYYYDEHDAANVIKKLKQAEEANDEDLYMRTLNDALRAGRVPKP